ncbi:MAG TPA: HipA domain-containing protein, partial [Alphaproteobacteria bacterium]|nr:HipA domain-containing protein [Alphaproteobacteria bacterium]
MARKRRALTLLMNGRKVGRLDRDTNGIVGFQYDPAWLDWQDAISVSRSLPLQEGRKTGNSVIDFFDNLLPDNVQIRRHLAERVGARGIDAFNLLDAVGRDCVGALQFVPEGTDPGDSTIVEGKPVSDAEIEHIVRNLKRAPLGSGVEGEFRISIAGAQDKTALLRRGYQWEIPHGATPTTHILKPAIGRLSNGLDLTASVENEHFCLTFLDRLGMSTARSEIARFGEIHVLVVERFDRLWSNGRLLRRPQEDMCQALNVPWTLKYQSEGGPSIRQIMDLLRASDKAEADRAEFFKAQIVFWLLGATDGHAKNFSIYLTPGERFNLTPFYDVLSAQPNVDMNQIRPEEFKLAMAMG